jgi:tRNA pseudouridine38-40 synthase
MVRAIVGTLLLVNENKLAVGDVSKILAGKDRSSAGRSVPPEGLYLQEIKYPEQIYIN